MKIAIPCVNKKLSRHFGHCQHFALIEADRQAKQIVAAQMLDAPEHEPGLLPRWLAEKGVNLVIAGGMGFRAQQIFEQNGIEVLAGVPVDEPEKIVSAWLQDKLEVGVNTCDH
ncbi:MAG: ATPase [Chitinivibrionales bacterium]|nr:ATPase [Chitinivibrionales bacterium]